MINTFDEKTENSLTPEAFAVLGGGEIAYVRPIRSEEVQRVLDSAEAIAEAYKVTLEPVLLQARDVAAAIVDEATERGADLLVAGLPYRKRFGGEFAIGRTIPYILQNAPCTVWVVREPISEATP